MSVVASSSRAAPRALLLFAACGPALGSCSGAGALHPVKGQVLHRNKPIAGAVVTFHPKGGDDIKAARPSGYTGEDGFFTVTTGPKTGAPAGDYVVTVVWLKAPEAPKAKKVITTEGPPDAEDLFKGHYADRARSGLTARVKAGTNVLEPFRLD